MNREAGTVSDFIKRWRRYFRVRKAMKRLYIWNVCPMCNSDAPELDDCPVCHGSRVFPIPPRDKLSMAAVYLTGVALEENMEIGR